ncbi:hypothetical protein F4809DRAFT_566125 [Biscogniauxia mediterranea]|nr:hypothetical protein F4809DRAFT_566125 [Biscogniauxia mediterranea]
MLLLLRTLPRRLGGAKQPTITPTPIRIPIPIPIRSSSSSSSSSSALPKSPSPSPSPSPFSSRPPRTGRGKGKGKGNGGLTGAYADALYLYPPRKVWPPDMARLPPRDQFRLERKYKRRLRLATARPRWDRAVRLAQLVGVSAVGVYCFFFMKWENEVKPVQGAKNSPWGVFASENRYERQELDIAPAPAAGANQN